MIKIETREVKTPVLLHGEQGFFVHNKFFLKKNYNEPFTSLTHSEAVELVDALLQIPTIRKHFTGTIIT